LVSDAQNHGFRREALSLIIDGACEVQPRDFDVDLGDADGLEVEIERIDHDLCCLDGAQAKAGEDDIGPESKSPHDFGDLADALLSLGGQGARLVRSAIRCNSVSQ
jgi:hypothetical protein